MAENKNSVWKKTVDKCKYWGQLLLLPVYGLSFLVPKNKRLWVFGSTFGRRFADNPRYMYLWINDIVRTAEGEKSAANISNTENVDNKDKKVSKSAKEPVDTNDYNICTINGKPIRPVWISHDQKIVDFLQSKGYEAYTYHSLKGIWTALRAKVYVFDNYSKDINFWQSGGAIKVNLWHGTGNKRINYDNRFDKVRHPKNLWEKWKYFPRRLSDEKPSHYVLATSDKMAKIFASAFQVDISHVLVNGYPRNDVMFKGRDISDLENNNNIEIVTENQSVGQGITSLRTAEEEKVYQSIISHKSQGKKIILYMPTFRESETKFFDVMDLQRFDEYLMSRGYVFYTKLHPKSKLKSRFAESEKDSKNIINISSDVDTYTILGEADMLVTDYSSVHTDYALLNRPSIMFIYDQEEYSGGTRDAYFDYEEYMPELRVSDMQSLMSGIDNLFENDDRKDRRKVLLDNMWKYQDGESSKRMVEMVKGIYVK